MDWIEYTPVPSYLYLDLIGIYLFSCILTPWKRLKLLLNLFYSCKIALKIFFPRGTEAVGRRQVVLSHVTYGNFNRCQNAINRLQRQDKDHDQPF